MLSAFTARPVVELKARDKSKIESVLSHGDRVFVGLNTGSLRIYRVRETQTAGGTSLPVNGIVNESNDSVVELLREEEKFSRRAVQQLAIIQEAGILIALSDGYVTLHDLDTYTLSERLEKTKGATCFVTTRSIDRDADSGIASIVSRLAVAVKRKILLWTWQDSELTGPPEELTLPATVKSLTWASNVRLIAGMDLGFSMVDLKAQTVSDINRATNAGEPSGPNGTRFGAVNASGMGYMGMGSWVPKPMSTKLGEQELLLVKDINSLFIDDEGHTKEKRQVPWTIAPDSIGFSYPYLLALLPPTKGMLELRNPETLTLLQSIPVTNATVLHVPQPNISLAHAGKGFLVASDRSIWRMNAVGYGPQIDQLMAGSHYNEALSLVALIEDTLLLDKHKRIQEIKTEKARALFAERDFRQAMELFSDAPARPSQVIALYPAAIAGDLSQSKPQSRPGTPELVAEDPKSDSWSPAKQKTPTAMPSKRVSTDTSDVSSVRGVTGVVAASTVSESAQLEGRDLKFAVNELRAFLAQTRVQLQKYVHYDGQLKHELQGPRRSEAGALVEPDFAHFIEYIESDSQESMRVKLLDAAILVDTTLFRAYMLVSPSLAGSLFRLDNFCSAEVVEEKLYESGRYNELVDFLGGKKLHQEALNLLEKFGKDESQDEALKDFRGPTRTIRYLQQLPFELIDLILQHARWPLQVDPTAGMQIFVADTENAESLPRDSVVEFLTSVDPSLVMRYLEHIINELDDPSSSFHDRLIMLYIDAVKRQTDQSPEDKDIDWQQKLDTFLRSSKHFDKNSVLKALPIDDSHFYESRAIVLSKLSFHKEALRIYVYQIQDHRKAEEYCNQVFLALASSTSGTLDPDDANISRAQSIYTTLLTLYLSPPHPYKQNLEQALEVLSLHGSRLPALTTLAALPTSLPIKDLESYFQARMRSATSIARENAIMASLSNVEKIAAESDLLLGNDSRTGVSKMTPASGRNRRVLLGENKLCNICHKRFGRAAARVFPSGEVLHYGCVPNQKC